MPISAEKDVFVTLTDEQAYEFEGKMEADHRGCAVSARVKRVSAIGSNVVHCA